MNLILLLLSLFLHSNFVFGFHDIKSLQKNYIKNNIFRLNIRRSTNNGKNNNNKAIATELTPISHEQLVLDLSQTKSSSCPTKFCYFDKRSPCPLDLTTGELFRCPIDDRFCGANRDYFDHVYGEEQNNNSNNDNNLIIKENNDDISDSSNNSDNSLNMMFDTGSLLTITTTTPTRRKRNNFNKKRSISSSTSTSSSQKRVTTTQTTRVLLNKKEKRLRRKKLFVMSTWIEDLLPDPYQGHSWVLNSVVNTSKFFFRAVKVMLYHMRLCEKPIHTLT